MREAQKLAFLAGAGWGDAQRFHLAGDASARSYERLVRPGGDTDLHLAVLMDAPPGCGDDVGAFHRIGTHLAGLGLSPPKTWAMDEALGLMLIEDLGEAVYARLLENAPALEAGLYADAVDVLVRLQAAPPPAGLPDLSAAEWAASAALAPEFYALAATGSMPDAGPFLAALEQAIRACADGPRVLILRDYHAENLLWLPARMGVARVGLLDFQLGQMGQPEYDLVSLLQDARRDVSPETEAAMIAHFSRETGRGDITAACATLGALRALRIIGIFARLTMTQGKDRYLAFLPRVWGQLRRNLAHPALAGLRAEVEAILPEPTQAIIERIRAWPTVSH
ncbi:aminoglycoside phosphotransferase family protein [Pseudogemmobacter bohemicus]|uniref:aminoglycoside phosphotransferase family protein n=1 Tax=Pseudogemmobacter bohemicus TaxID=2250708 RepID=UPI000DD32CF5|nr:phosphotransferase [Pseudogemmobacter bohemicus]